MAQIFEYVAETVEEVENLALVNKDWLAVAKLVENRIIYGNALNALVEAAGFPILSGRAEDKRTWFKDEANRARLRQVIELVLTNRKIRIVPAEITIFSNLSRLTIQNSSKLTSLPQELGTLHDLRFV